MKKPMKSVLCAALLSLAAVPSFATVTVSGLVYLHGAYDSCYYSGANTTVKLCVSNASGAVGQGECYSAVTRRTCRSTSR